MSLANLSKEIDNGFYNTVLNILINSNEYPLKKFIYKMLGRPPLNLRKDAKYFDKFWNYAFKFRKAEIATNKGKFIIERFGQVAPVLPEILPFLHIKIFSPMANSTVLYPDL